MMSEPLLEVGGAVGVHAACARLDNVMARIAVGGWSLVT